MMRENEEEKERKGMRVLRCGFFGTTSTMNLCSKCYRDCQMREEQTATAMAAVEKSMTSAPSSPAPAKIIVHEKAVEKWMYLVPLGFVLMNAMSQDMNMPEEQAGSGGQAAPAGPAVRRR